MAIYFTFCTIFCTSTWSEVYFKRTEEMSDWP